MAEKRMFSRSIICTDAFTELTHRARCLYFYLCLAADDVGVVANPGAVMRESVCGAGDMKALTDSGYVVRLKNSLVLIRHWFANNAIRSERMKPTQYAAALKGVICDPNSRAYIMPGEEGNPAQEDESVTQTCHPTGVPECHPIVTPDGHPTGVPDGHPTGVPECHPTATSDGHPTATPDGHPTMAPSCHPTWVPTCHPTWVPACAQTVPVEERSIDKINIKEERGEREEERETTELSHSFLYIMENANDGESHREEIRAAEKVRARIPAWNMLGDVRDEKRIERREIGISGIDRAFIRENRPSARRESIRAAFEPSARVLPGGAYGLCSNLARRGRDAPFQSRKACQSDSLPPCGARFGGGTLHAPAPRAAAFPFTRDSCPLTNGF